MQQRRIALDASYRLGAIWGAIRLRPCGESSFETWAIEAVWCKAFIHVTNSRGPKLILSNNSEGDCEKNWYKWYSQRGQHILLLSPPSEQGSVCICAGHLEGTYPRLSKRAAFERWRKGLSNIYQLKLVPLESLSLSRSSHIRIFVLPSILDVRACFFSFCQSRLPIQSWFVIE